MFVQVKGIAPHGLNFALERGITIVDVRVPWEFDLAHISGSINVPIYQAIEGAHSLVSAPCLISYHLFENQSPCLSNTGYW